MEFITRKALLFKGLQRVQGIADTKGAIPILSHVLIKAIDDQAWIFATDLKIGIKGSVPATVKREGRVTLPAKRIFDIVRELPDGDVLISTDTADQSTYENQWINVCAGNYRSKIPCMPPEIFPEFPSFDKDYIIRFKPEILKNMIRKTILATSNEEGRPALTGVLMEVDSDNAVFVSTDGHRLSFVRTENKTPTEKKHSLILPQKTCSELIKFIEPVDEDILFALYENQAVFRQGDLVLVSRLIEEGKYPRYEGVIPEKGESCAVLKKEELISSLKRVSVLAGEDSGMVRFCLRPNE
ncbi:MAG: DNA polymerase III subunit beta, partial [Nitrospinota bacterium]